MGAEDVRLDGADGVVDDELDADGGGEVDDGVALGDEAVHDHGVHDGVDDEGKGGLGDERLEVGEGAGGEVVDDGDGVAAGDEGFGEVGADEAGAAGDEVVGGNTARCLRISVEAS